MNDSIKDCKPVKNSLEVTHEIMKLIKYSPRCEGIFQGFKDTHDLSVGHHTPGVRVLCPTRWTVCANALASVISNYEVLLSTWDEAVEVISDTECKARINGVASQMKRFEFAFGAILGEMVLRHSDNLGQCLQKKTISAAERQHVAKWLLTHCEVLGLKSLMTCSGKRLFISVKTTMCKKHNYHDLENCQHVLMTACLGDTLLLRLRNIIDKCTMHEAIDTAIGCLLNRFDQEGYRVYRNLEDVLIKASLQENFDQQFLFVCEFFKDDQC